MWKWLGSAIGALQILVLMLSGQAASADDLAGILEVEITGLKDATGDVYISVYDSEATWLGDETVLTKKVDIAKARDGDVVRTELQLPLGDYAISAFYDRNGDGVLDTNWLGHPKEPTAYSNNAVGKLGSPDFADAVFKLDAEPIIQRIDLHQK
jgi:uncharacterized protein (DUF2141 family)